MSDTKELSTKVTYSYEQREILILKEAYQRDLTLFVNLLKSSPKDWSFTVITTGARRELVVNVPAKKK